jgi:hypothetical protein
MNNKLQLTLAIFKPDIALNDIALSVKLVHLFTIN